MAANQAARAAVEVMLSVSSPDANHRTTAAIVAIGLRGSGNKLLPRVGPRVGILPTATDTGAMRRIAALDRFDCRFWAVR